jgi:retinol dehydrogenase 12
MHHEETIQNRVILVTGATSGIGLAAVKTLAALGLVVIGVGRSEERNQKAQQAILEEVPAAKLIYLLADLSEQSQVRQLAEEVGQVIKGRALPGLSVLINNAGVYLERKHLTVDGIEMTFAVNHLAPFLLTQTLLPRLMASHNPRVLTVSSYSHVTTCLTLPRIANPWPYVGLLAYKRSKLCNVLFTYELNRRYKFLRAFAVDPGLVNTDIASKGSQGISHWIWRRKRHHGTPASVPAETIRFLALENNIDISRGYYFKDSMPKQPSRNARRSDLAQKLWTLSSQLVSPSKNAVQI